MTKKNVSLIALCVMLSVGPLFGDDSTNVSTSELFELEEKKDSSWGDVCKIADKTVCQVFCHRLSPNFREPYLPPTRSGGCSGSGFCISGDGYILTNFHVVNGSVATAVQFPELGREQYRVDYIGGCPDYDVALLKLTNESLEAIRKNLGITDLSYVALGNSDAVSNGEKLLAAGYPLGFENIKIVFGVCSGREETVGDMIQSTLPINPGNSGGPAFNKQGEVIGITSSGMAKWMSEGVNFVIPSNNVKALLGSLLENPIVRSPHWGFSIVDVTPNTLKSLGCERSGALLSRVRKLSLFENAGLKKGDVLLEVNNLVVDCHGYVKAGSDGSLVTVYNYLSRLPLDSELALSYYRDGEISNVKIVIEQPPKLAVNEWAYWSDPLPDYDMIGGLVFSQLSINLIREVLPAAAQGMGKHQGRHVGTVFKYGKVKNRLNPKVCVSTCLPNSQAYRALNRLTKTCDCIVKKINGKEVNTIDDLRDAILSGSKNADLVVESEGGIIVALPLDAILKEEELLAQQYGYKPTELYHKLIKTRQEHIAEGDDASEEDYLNNDNNDVEYDEA